LFGARLPYCHDCGKEVEPGIKFCPNCGAPQGTGTPGGAPTPPPAAKGPPRPALASLLIIGYLVLGIILVFFGAYTLFVSSLFTMELLVIAILLFLGNGVLSLLTVYGFLKGGRWAPTYIAVTGVCCIAGGLLLAISSSVGLVVLGSIAVLLGAVTLAYLKFGNARKYLAR
jgi:zinc-ribbon domain